MKYIDNLLHNASWEDKAEEQGKGLKYQGRLGRNVVQNVGENISEFGADAKISKESIVLIVPSNNEVSTFVGFFALMVATSDGAVHLTPMRRNVKDNQEEINEP